MKIVKTFQPKIVIFTAVKNRCMLHRRVFVMMTAVDISTSNESLHTIKGFVKLCCFVVLVSINHGEPVLGICREYFLAYQVSISSNFRFYAKIKIMLSVNVHGS